VKFTTLSVSGRTVLAAGSAANRWLQLCRSGVAEASMSVSPWSRSQALIAGRKQPRARRRADRASWRRRTCRHRRCGCCERLLPGAAARRGRRRRRLPRRPERHDVERRPEPVVDERGPEAVHGALVRVLRHEPAAATAGLVDDDGGLADGAAVGEEQHGDLAVHHTGLAARRRSLLRGTSCS
jgi:hypothetical protein